MISAEVMTYPGKNFIKPQFPRTVQGRPKKPFYHTLEAPRVCNSFRQWRSLRHALSLPKVFISPYSCLTKMKTFTILMAILFAVASVPRTGLAQEDYKVLPIKGRLDVELVFLDVDPAWFGARNLNELVKMIAKGVRGTARSTLWSDSQPQYAPFEFEVWLAAREFRLAALDEFRLMLRSLNQPAPRELLQLWGLDSDLSSIHAPAALKMLVDLSRKYAPDILDRHVIYFICGARALGTLASYHTFGQLPETGKPGGELFLNMYGGPWYGRYVFVDLCAQSQYDDYPPIQNLSSASERLNLLTQYVDEIIDLQFVKSNIYYPRYNLQLLVDIIVVDATNAGLNFDNLLQAFDLEMTEQSLVTLTPYNLYTFKVRYITADKIPGFKQIITVDKDRRIAVFDAEKAYRLLKTNNILEEGGQGFVYVPSIVVVTDYDTEVGVDGDTALGVALPDLIDPRYGGVAVAGASYYSLFYEGMAVTVAHEIGHVLGLRHPHDDFNEIIGQHVYRRIYTDGIETFMSYSTTWVEAAKRRPIKENYYPIKTYWSIFDLDAIDRAVISILLSSYETNYENITKVVGQLELNLDDLQELKNALELSKQYARKSVELFKIHNYFDRFSFKGLAAQLETSFDYAFMAYALTDLSKIYLAGVALHDARLKPQLQALKAEISSLTDSLNRLKKESSQTESELRNIENLLKSAREKGEDLKNRLQSLSAERAQLSRLQSQKEELSQKISSESRRLEELSAAVNSVKPFGSVLTGLIVVVMVGAVVFIMFVRRR